MHREIDRCISEWTATRENGPLADELQAFSFGALNISGTVQNRVVRETVSGTLDFFFEFARRGRIVVELGRGERSYHHRSRDQRQAENACTFHPYRDVLGWAQSAGTTSREGSS